MDTYHTVKNTEPNILVYLSLKIILSYIYNKYICTAFEFEFNDNIIFLLFFLNYIILSWLQLLSV